MILSDKTIKQYIDTLKLATNVSSDIHIQPASLDITLGDTFSAPDKDKIANHISTSNGMSTNIINISDKIEYKTIQSDSYMIMPKEFVLATTEQYFRFPDNLTAFVEGRSSVGRLGLFIQNAGWIDPGFEGQITLELFNASDYAINLIKGFRIGQLVFATMDKHALNPYRGKYQGQIGATGSRIYKDFE
jgi:dCTP deaminase